MCDRVHSETGRFLYTPLTRHFLIIQPVLLSPTFGPNNEHYRKPRGITHIHTLTHAHSQAAGRAVDKIDFTPGPCRKNATSASPPPRIVSLPLSSRITFDSAKFETSFHATPPLFHVGRDARIRGREADGGGNLSRNSKRLSYGVLLLTRPFPLPLSCPYTRPHCPSPTEVSNGGKGEINRYRISVVVFDETFFSPARPGKVLFVRRRKAPFNSIPIRVSISIFRDRRN